MPDTIFGASTKQHVTSQSMTWIRINCLPSYSVSKKISSKDFINLWICSLLFSFNYINIEECSRSIQWHQVFSYSHNNTFVIIQYHIIKAKILILCCMNVLIDFVNIYMFFCWFLPFKLLEQCKSRILFCSSYKLISMHICMYLLVIWSYGAFACI